MNPLAWIQGLEGPTLVAIICGLLFLEEVGVPLPFAPGDLLLAIGGIAIAAGRVNPALLPGAAAASVMAGAIAGRELFALLGWERLMRVARPLRAEEPLRRAAELMHRSGWRAVFTARLVPGLRVYTTQVAGVTGMRRRDFVAGLAPATALYVTAFVGLGAAFGRPILALIHQAEHQLLVVALVLAVPVALAILLRAPARRTLASVGGWNGMLRFRLDSPGFILVPACIGLDFAGHAVAVAAALPLFLDSTGTVLCALLAGPWVGASVGVIASLLSANTVDANAAGYVVVSFAIGFAAGLTRIATRSWVALWIVCFLVASVLSTPLNLVLLGGGNGVPLGDAIHAALAPHLPSVAATYAAEAAIDLPDKLLAVLGALLLYRAFPAGAIVSRAVELNLAVAFTFVFRSRRGVRSLLVAALCLLLGWLVLPLLLVAGYAVAVAREAGGGGVEPPTWRPLGRRLADGLRLALAFAAWIAPSGLLSAAAGFAGATGGAVLGALSGVWLVLVLVAQPAIWSEVAGRGLRGGLDAPAVVRRMRRHAGLTSVIGVLAIGLLTFALSGLVLFGAGVALTLPYATWAAAHLFGEYSALTDETAARTA
jgi:energy-coupling factor transport system substrate-specific component